MWYISKNEELDRDIGRKVDSEWDTREVMDIFYSIFYYKVAVSSRKKYDFSGLQ